MSVDTVKAQLAQVQALIASILGDPLFGVPTSTTTTIRVSVNGDLQKAIDAATPGDTILVAPGNYPGVVLSAKPAGVPIVIAPDTTALKPGQRVDPSMVPAMITLTSTNNSPLRAAPGAGNYILRGVAMQTFGDGRTPLVTLGGDSTTTDVTTLPDNVVLDQVLLVGATGLGGKRGMQVNTRGLKILNSYCKDFWFNGQDSQAISAWAGPGGFHIENCYLEASGENILFGGADNKAATLNPTNIVIRGNYLTKPLTWQASSTGDVKNSLEFKNAVNILVEQNIIENVWSDAQSGTVVLFTPRNQGGTAPWSQVANVVFQWNVVRNGGAGISMLGRDDLHQSQRLIGVKILNNLFYNIDKKAFLGTGRLFAIANGVKDVEIAHNTCIAPGNQNNSAVSLDVHTGSANTPEMNEDVNIHDNVLSEGSYGMIASGQTPGVASWTATVTGNSAFERNLMMLGTSGRKITYPGTQNYKTTSAGESAVGDDFKLLPAYAGLASTDGKPLGCDVDTLRASVVI